MKKALAFLLVLIMVFAMAACTAKADPSSTEPAAAETTEATETPAVDVEAENVKAYEGVTLKVWLAPFVRDDVDQSFWSNQLDAFETETGATVEVEIVGWGDMATKYLTAFMSDSAADVLYMTNEIAYDFINQGCLTDLESYWSADEIENENYWDTTYYRDKHYLIPFLGGNSQRGFIYNMDILNECGVDKVPTTWDELLDACEKIHSARPDIYTLLNPMTGNNNAFLTNMLGFLYQAGGSMVNDEGTAYTLNTPEALDAMTFIQTLVDNGYLSTDCLGLDDSSIRDLFGEGKVAISVVDAPYIYFEEAPFAWQFSTELAKSKNEQSVCFAPIDTLAVNAKTKNTDAAVALLKYLRSDEVMTAFFTDVYAGGQILKSYPNMITDEHMDDVFAHPERAFVLPVAPNLQVVVDSCINNQQLMVMGQLTPEEALLQIQAEADKAFN